MQVYMIDHYDSVNDFYSGIQPGLGVFVSEEAAEAKAQELSGGAPLKCYVEFRLRMLREYTARVDRHEREVAKHNVLREAGLVTGDYPFVLPSPRETEPYSTWGKRWCNRPEYTVEGPYDVAE